jgi:acyl-CoA thioesterase FadM
MPYEFKHIRRVEFSDTDMAGIMHFSNFFRFMESTETALCARWACRWFSRIAA